MLYFGCIGRPGHYLWSPEGKQLWGELPDDFPEAWTWHEPYGMHRAFVRESSIAPCPYGPEGSATMTRAGGWAALSFPDRTVDSRPNCVSVFLVDDPEILSFAILKQSQSGVSARHESVQLRDQTEV